jgi:hypothetical protein
MMRRRRVLAFPGFACKPQRAQSRRFLQNGTRLFLIFLHGLGRIAQLRLLPLEHRFGTILCLLGGCIHGWCSFMFDV